MSISHCPVEIMGQNISMPISICDDKKCQMSMDGNGVWSWTDQTIDSKNHEIVNCPWCNTI